MELAEVIERAFEGREMPQKVTDSNCTDLLDTDVADTLWFSGKNWLEITWDDWKKHTVALSFFNQAAVAYWLPSVLLLSLERAGEYMPAADYLIKTFGSRCWAPSPVHWKDHFRERFVGLRVEEYEAIKEWLVSISKHKTYGISRLRGPGDIFERALETVSLAQRETMRVADRTPPAPE